VARLFIVALLVAGAIAGVYAWKHRAALDNPQIPAPGPVVVTVNPLP
jgi:hypothetical protein